MNSEPRINEESLGSANSSSNSFSTNSIVDEFRTFMNDYPLDNLGDAGIANWECSTIESYPENIHLVSVPFVRGGENEVVNILVGIKTQNGTWRYRLINKKYYEWKHASTKFLTNKWYYQGVLKEIARLQQKVYSGCEDLEIDYRCQDIVLCVDDQAGSYSVIINCETLDAVYYWYMPCSEGSAGGSLEVLGDGTIVWTNNDGGAGGAWENDNWDPSEDTGISYPDNNNNGGDSGGGPGNYNGFSCQGSGMAQIANFDETMNHLNNFIASNNIEGYTAWDLLDYIQPECIGSNNFNSCMSASLMCSLMDIDGFDIENNIDCLIGNPNEILKIESFLNEHEGSNSSTCTNSDGIQILPQENLSRAIANAYADLLCDENVEESCSESWMDVAFNFINDAFTQGDICFSSSDNIESELINELVGFSCNPSSLVDACSGDPVSESTIAAALLNSDLTLGGFHEEMDGVNYIIMPKSVENDCPKYYCVMNEMMNGSLGTSFICDLLTGFDGSTGNNDGDGFHLHINTLDFSTRQDLRNDVYAGTRAFEQRPGSGDYRILIRLNTLRCNDHGAIEVFETLQHELIHADIKRSLIEEYEWDTENSSYTEAFHQLVIEEYGGQAGEDEHKLMLDYYLDQMVNSLIEMNNGIGTYDDFVGGVLNGFPEDALNYCGVPLSDVQSSYNDFLNFISQPGNINQTLQGCN